MTRYSFAILLFLLLLSSCGSDTQQQASSESEFRTVEWAELIPEDDLEALLNPPDYLWEIEDGGANDQLNSNLQASPVEGREDRYQQALVSTEVIEELDGEKIRVPGFIVPLEFSEGSIVTTFFLVPFFGACTHEPPPPPNQIIYSEFEPGKLLENLYDPVWITGVLHTSTVTNDLATAAYSVIVDSISPYVYE